jgi:hypothetical protein
MSHRYGVGFGPRDPVFELAVSICRRLKKAPERFLHLARVGLLPGCTSEEYRQKQTLSFADRRARSVQGVHQIARMLDDVGIIFLDEDDTV